MRSPRCSESHLDKQLSSMYLCPREMRRKSLTVTLVKRRCFTRREMIPIVARTISSPLMKNYLSVLEPDIVAEKRNEHTGNSVQCSDECTQTSQLRMERTDAKSHPRHERDNQDGTNCRAGSLLISKSRVSPRIGSNTGYI
jgi:hypothetical protein